MLSPDDDDDDLLLFLSALRSLDHGREKRSKCAVILRGKTFSLPGDGAWDAGEKQQTSAPAVTTQEVPLLGKETPDFPLASLLQVAEWQGGTGHPHPFLHFWL